MSLSNTEPMFDVLVVGDEVESCLTAVSAARLLGKEGKVGLLRLADKPLLGGLCTRGGLSYMDITPDYLAPLFGEFLKQAEFLRVALHPQKAHQALVDLLDEAHVSVQVASPYLQAERLAESWQLTEKALGQQWQATVLIDATPDGQFDWLYGQCIEGLGGILGKGWPNTMGVSPVFHTTGVDRVGLVAFEEALRQRPETALLIEKGLPWLSAVEQAERLTRPVFSPPGMDYIDILNPVIGLWFHRWLGHEPDTYPVAHIKVDGFNISRLSDETAGEVLGWNGLVAQVDDVAQQLDLSRGLAPCPEPIHTAAQQFVDFLKSEGGFSKVKLMFPQEMYVRQTRQFAFGQTLSTVDLLTGGVNKADAVGTFSYWIDLRGVSLQQVWPTQPVLPKPVFNVGIRPYIANTGPNLALVSRSAGTGPIAQGACRIVQHLSQVGEAMGIAAALAVQQQVPLADVASSWVQQHLERRYQRTQQRSLPVEGRAVWTAEQALCHPALVREHALLEGLQSARLRG